MIRNQLALVRRELWEHRAIYVAPLIIALIISLLSVTGQVAISAAEEAVNLSILGATHLGEHERAAAITGALVGISSVFMLGMGILTIFYSLDSLYAERKDKSILFWRSIPVTDAETVVSKLLTAGLVIPAATFIVLAVTHVVVLLTASIWVALRGANAWHIIWQAAPFFDNWSATLVFLLALQVWMAPFIGWFLLVSAYTKRSPFLMAFLPIIVLPMLERIIVGTHYFGEAIFGRLSRLPILEGIDASAMFSDHSDKLHMLRESGFSLMSMLNVSGFLASPAMWAGLVVCGLFTVAAIYVRRYRDES